MFAIIIRQISIRNHCRKKLYFFPTALTVDLGLVHGLPVDRNRLVGHHCSIGCHKKPHSKIKVDFYDKINCYLRPVSHDPQIYSARDVK